MPKNDALIEQLRELLEAAEAGEITGIAFVTVNEDNTTGTGWGGSASGHIFNIIGALAVVQREFSDAFVEGLRG